MKACRSITPCPATKRAYFSGNVAYWRGCPSPPSEAVSTHGWRISADTSSICMLKEAILRAAPLLPGPPCRMIRRSEEHTSELQSRENLVCRLLLEKKELPTHAP